MCLVFLEVFGGRWGREAGPNPAWLASSCKRGTWGRTRMHREQRVATRTATGPSRAVGEGPMDTTPCWHCQGPRSARWHATHAFCKRTLSLLLPNGKRECRKLRASPRTRRCSRIRTHRPNSPRHRKELDCISVTDHARFPRRQFVYVNLHNSLPCIFLR